jgi:ADP-ribose pyrophosphatase YjhB (NUDIX family)
VLHRLVSEAVARETKEESGYDVDAVRLMAIYDRDRHAHPPCPVHVYKVIFLCNLVGGSAKTSLETEAVSFFGEDELPALFRISSALKTVETRVRFRPKPESAA